MRIRFPVSVARHTVRTQDAAPRRAFVPWHQCPALAPAHRTGLVQGELPPLAAGAVGDLLEHPEDLTDTAHQQPLLLDLDPASR